MKVPNLQSCGIPERRNVPWNQDPFLYLANSFDSKWASFQQVPLYTVDFNEELSAFGGNVLREQSKFLTAVIDFICCDSNSQESTDTSQNFRELVLVGHSMGGLVAVHASHRYLQRYECTSI